MSKRITLTDEDIELLCAILDAIQRQGVINSVAYPELKLTIKQRMDQVKDKLTTEPVTKPKGLLKVNHE